MAAIGIEEEAAWTTSRCAGPWSLCETFGRPSEWIAWDPDDCDADARVEPHETTADILAYYARARAAADSVIDDIDIDIDQVATPPPGLGSSEVTLRWLLIHVLEDTARHAGHMDILRELIDGRIGAPP